MNNVYEPKGVHILFDLYGVDYDKLNDAVYLSGVYKDGIIKCGATIMNYQEKLFEPCGVTFTYILSESHSSAHSYCYEGVLLGDIFTCGDVDPMVAVDYIVEHLQPTEKSVRVLQRGK